MLKLVIDSLTGLRKTALKENSPNTKIGNDRKTRSGKIPENRLHSFSGLLQTDGYSGYTKLGKQENITHLGCWDHARRKFVDADKVCANKGKGIASEFIKSIAKLYKIEREIKQASDGKRYQARVEAKKG